MATGSSKRKEDGTKLVLIGIFLGIFALITFGLPGLRALVAGFHPGLLDLILLSFATYRLGHLVSYDKVTEPLRRPFTCTIPDPTGAGESVEPRGSGIRYALGEMLCCPICSGTWIAAGLVYLLLIFPGPARVFLYMTAAIGAAELLNSLSEALSWTGQLARVRSGIANERQDLPGKNEGLAAPVQEERN